MTLSNAFSDLVAFVVIAGVILLGFTALFHFTLGTYLREFSRIDNSLYMVMLGLSAVWEPYEWYVADPVTAIFLMIIFTFLSTWLLATIIIAIITESFVEAKREVYQRLFQSEIKKQQKRVQMLAWVNADPFGLIDLRDAGVVAPPIERATNALFRTRSAMPSRGSAKGLGLHTSKSAIGSIEDERGHPEAATRLRDGASSVDDNDGQSEKAAEGGPKFHLSLADIPPSDALWIASAEENVAGLSDRKQRIWKRLNQAFTNRSGKDACGSKKSLPSSKEEDLMSPRRRKEEDLMSPRRRISQISPLNLLQRSAFSSHHIADKHAPKKEYVLKVALWEAINIVAAGHMCNPNVKLHIEQPVRHSISSQRSERAYNIYHHRHKSRTVSNARQQFYSAQSQVDPSSPLFEWNECFSLALPANAEECVLVVSIYDQDRFSQEKLLGFTIIPIRNLLDDDLEPLAAASLELTLRRPSWSNEKAPLMRRADTPLSNAHSSHEDEGQEDPTLFLALRAHKKASRSAAAIPGLCRRGSALSPSSPVTKGKDNTLSALTSQRSNADAKSSEVCGSDEEYTGIASEDGQKCTRKQSTSKGAVTFVAGDTSSLCTGAV
eukprot:CAMPEP_0113229886 /NCGR_PEP_ID=MMETSP0008_2-20120614/596_1 /TAXON_ID=97485 /ORGANISM="Prymnesium parvum" /LENGTH=606 /DNA_ID=CAMNT_0000076445 /DNA_START=231 /DNA_END=2051 /DNA_ORIENTATION=- /assembly_acc=CAM_ASM_000153